MEYNSINTMTNNSEQAISELRDRFNAVTKIQGEHIICIKNIAEYRQPKMSVNDIRYPLHFIHRMIVSNKLLTKLDTDRYVKCCDVELCIISEHWLHKENDAYDIAKYILLKRCDQDGDHLSFNGAIDPHGYGSTMFRGKHVSTHALMMMIKLKSPIPDGKIVRHMCLKKNCCAIIHLELGTPKENADDKNRDGTMPSCETHPRATLTNDMVLEIYNYPKDNNMPYTKMAIMFSEKFDVEIQDQTVANICRGRSWNGVTEQEKIVQIRKKKLIDQEFIDEHYIGIQQTIRKNSEVRHDEKSIVNFGIDNPHWIWRLDGSKRYGIAWYLNAYKFAHVMSYMAFNKTIIPTGLLVRHMCNEPLCVSPNHLKIGTAAENMADKRIHGTVLLGEKNLQSKLSANMIINVYISRIFELTSVDRAKLFNMSLTFIYDIDNKRSWKDTTNEINVIESIPKLCEYIESKPQFKEKIKHIDPATITSNLLRLHMKCTVSTAKCCLARATSRLIKIMRMDDHINSKIKINNNIIPHH